MSGWNDFCDDVSRFANKAAKKTGELAHTASLRIKLEGVKNKLSSAFERLGRLTFKQIETEESQAEKIAKVMDEIKALREEEKRIIDQIEQDKAKKEEN